MALKVIFERICGSPRGKGDDVDEILSEIQPSHLVLLDGEAGVGKTRLIDEFLSRLSPPPQVLW